MTISLQERLTIVCPKCGAPAEHDVWLIVDAAEQPEAAAALAAARLNLLGCEQCGHRFLAPAPLLYHDQAHRRVVFVPPPNTDELTWRDMAYELHAVLVGSIALEQRQLYLSDMQIAQDQAGLAHMLQKSTRRTSSGSAPPRFGKPVSSVIGDLRLSQLNLRGLCVLPTRTQIICCTRSSSSLMPIALRLCSTS